MERLSIGGERLRGYCCDGSLVVSGFCLGFTFGRLDEPVGKFMQFFDEQGKEICEALQKMGSSLMQIRLVADEWGMIFLIVAEDAVVVAADDTRGAVELAAGNVVSLKAAHVIEPAFEAARVFDAERLYILWSRVSRFNSLSSI